MRTAEVMLDDEILRRLRERVMRSAAAFMRRKTEQGRLCHTFFRQKQLFDAFSMNKAVFFVRFFGNKN